MTKDTMFWVVIIAVFGLGVIGCLIAIIVGTIVGSVGAIPRDPPDA